MRNLMNRYGMDMAGQGNLYSDEELEFLKAIDHFKRHARRPYPTWTEVLSVLKSLGYAKPTPINPDNSTPLPA